MGTGVFESIGDHILFTVLLTSCSLGRFLLTMLLITYVVIVAA